MKTPNFLNRKGLGFSLFMGYCKHYDPKQAFLKGKISQRVDFLTSGSNVLRCNKNNVIIIIKSNIHTP